MSIVALHHAVEDRKTKIAELRALVNSILSESRELIDAAVESKYDFGLIAKARALLLKAETANNEIKRLEQLLHIDKPKVNVKIA